MNIYSLTCTRKNNTGKSFDKLMQTFEDFGVDSKVLYDKTSIFSAYQEGFQEIKKEAKSDDIVILCHDDIEIENTKEKFIELLSYAQKDGVGFIGVAGIRELHPTGVWWNRDYLSAGYGLGRVYHHDDENPIYYGGFGPAVVMDGLFLAATVKTLDLISLKKPKAFDGCWDFYDLLYCHRMNKMGKINLVLPITIRHHSSGEVENRDGWHANRIAFLENISRKDLKIRGQMGIIGR